MVPRKKDAMISRHTFVSIGIGETGWGVNDSRYFLGVKRVVNAPLRAMRGSMVVKKMR